MMLTVTVNPALDLSYHLDALRPGETHRVSKPIIRAGGKGINVARVAHAQGARVHALATAGGATGELIRADLAAADVPHTLIPVAGETRRSLAFSTASGEATIVNEQGAELSSAERQAILTGVAEISAAGLVNIAVVSGSFPPRTPRDFVHTLVRSLSGVPVIVDTSGPLLCTAAAAGATLLAPNLEELQQATGIAEPYAAAESLLAAGARSVLISMGPEGFVLFRAEDAAVWRARPAVTLRGNPTGAGDAAVAAIASGFLTQAEPKRCDDIAISTMLRRAVAWSAAAVLAPAAGELADRHEEFFETAVIVRDAAPAHHS